MEMGLLAQNPHQSAAWLKPACDWATFGKFGESRQSSVEFALRWPEMPPSGDSSSSRRFHAGRPMEAGSPCRLCRTHAIMPIYYAGIKGHAQSIRHPTSTQRTLSCHIAYRNKHARYQNKNAEHLPSNIIMGTKSVLKSQSDSTHGGHTHTPTGTSVPRESRNPVGVALLLPAAGAAGAAAVWASASSAASAAAAASGAFCVRRS
jgi:hypothetical protein